MRWLRAVAVLVVIGLTTAVNPAWACACGGYLPDAGSPARASGENALVRFDGQREEIMLSMAVRGASKKAAWIMPVPAAADVELGEADAFGLLEKLTRPKVEIRRTYWPFRDVMFAGGGPDTAAGAPGAGVTVRGQMVLGPFQVARLGSTSAAAVTDWLAANGYVVPAGLGANLTPYLTEKWEIVAVKLAPRDPGDQLSGQTPPLRLSFPSERIVYPMRLSKGATTDQTVTVYVAAPYRVEPTTLPDPAVAPELLYAGRVTEPRLPQLADRTSYLTAYTVSYDEPGRIINDFQFSRAASDEPFQRVRYVTENDGTLSTLGLVFGGLLALGLGSAALARRLRTRS